MQPGPNGQKKSTMETELTKEDWQEVINECAKQMELMCKTLKNMKLAAQLQETTFEKAKEEITKAKPAKSA